VIRPLSRATATLASLQTLLDWLQRLEPSAPACDDGIWVGAPDEWPGSVAVALCGEAVDGGLEIDDRAEHAVLETAAGERCEKAFDGGQP
jgi:hypothetical protein